MLVVLHGEASMGAWIAIGGLIGAPHVLSWQQALNASLEQTPPDEEA